MNEKNNKKYLKSLALLLAVTLMTGNSGILALASTDNFSPTIESSVVIKGNETSGSDLSNPSTSPEENLTFKLNIGETYQLPTDGAEYENKTESILSIDEETKILTSKKAGVGKVTIDGEEYTFIVSYQFELTEDQVIMGLISTHQLSVKDLLEEYTDKLEWESADTSIVTVDQNGLITPVQEGNTKIKVTSDKGEDYEYSIEIPVSVTNNEYFYFSKEVNEVEFKALKEIDFSANIDTDKITFVSESPEIIGVNNKIVTSIAPGEAILKAIYKDASGTEKAIGSCTVKTIGDISIDDSIIDSEKNPSYKSDDFVMYSVDYNDKLKFSANVTPESFSEEDYNKYVTWKSTNENNATVDQTGLVKIIGFGGADIIVTLFEGTTSEVSKEITVGSGFEAEVTPSFDSMQIGETITLSVSSTSEYLRNHNYEWVSSDPEIATVDSEGKVTAIKEGTVAIYPVSEALTKAREELSSNETDGETATTPIISVIEVEGTTITKNDFSMYIGKTRDLGDNALLDNAITRFERQHNVKISKDGKIEEEPTSSEPTSSEPTSSEPTSSEFTSSEPESGENEQTLILDWDISNNDALYIEKSIATALDYGVVNVSPFVEIDGQRMFLTNEDGSKLTFEISVINKFNMEAEKNMKVGETSKIICSGLPLDTILSSENATWASDDETVATVDGDGNVTTVGPGSCFITFTSKELDRENQLVNNDNTPVEYVCQVYSTYSFDMETADQEMGIFEHKKLNYELDPYNIHDKIEWKSSDEKILVVDENGVVSTVGFGTATVTAKLFDTVKTVKITVSYESSTPATSANKRIEIGSTDTIDIANYIPETVSADPSTFRWFSTDESVLTVDENGTVTAVGLGNAEIIAGIVSGSMTANYYSCKYEVVCEIELEETKEIEVFQSMYAKDIIKYISSEECIPTLKWTIDDTNIITIDGMGIITAGKVGKTKVRTSISGKDYECEIVVKGTLNLSDDHVEIIRGNEFDLLTLFENGGNETLKQSLKYDALDTNVLQVIGHKMYGKNFGTTKVRITSDYFDEVYEVIVEVTYLFTVSDNVNLMVGQSLEVTSSKDPSDLGIVWTSSDENIASVDSNGKVTALNTGDVTIKAVVNNDKEYVSHITISLPISLEVPEHIIIKNKIPVNLIVPEGIAVSDFDSVEWKSSDESIATIDENGMATGINAGTTQISATVKYKNFENTYTVDLTVENIALESITIVSTRDQIDLTEEDHTAKLSLELNPGDATGLGEVTWKSLNKKVAIIDQDGNLTAVGQGTVMITAELNGKTANYVITVIQAIEDIAIEFNYEQVTAGNEYQAILKVNPEEATESVIPEWSSSDESIFTVDENGLVKALKKGTAKLTAKIKGFEAEYEITVGGADIITEPETPDKPETPDVTEKPSVSNSDVSNSDIDKPKVEDKDKDTASEDTTSSDNENQKPVSDSDKESRGNTDEDTSSNNTPSDDTSSKSEKDNTSKDNEKPSTNVNTGESNTMNVIAYISMILASTGAAIVAFFKRKTKRESQA